MSSNMDQANAVVGQKPLPKNMPTEIYPGVTTRAAVHQRPRNYVARQARRLRVLGDEAGMATAEYAIATLAAVGFAGLLVVILKSDEVRGFLTNIIRSALSM